MAQHPLSAAEMADVIATLLGFSERDILHDVVITREGWHDAGVSSFGLRLASGQEFRIRVEASVPTPDLGRREVRK
jgi:hypothetical protein